MSERILVLCITVIFLISACSGSMTSSEKRAVTGAGAGSIAGTIPEQLKGGNAGAALPGTAAGAVAGGLAGSTVGSYMDRQEQEFQRQVAGREGTTVQRYRNDLSITLSSDVVFDAGSSLIKPGGYDEISRIADILNRYPETRITIATHTDDKGSKSDNTRLSEERARSVADALTAGGVDPRRLNAVGVGASRPIVSNNTETGRQLNRRVTLLVVPVEG